MSVLAAAGCVATRPVVEPSNRIFSLGFDIPQGVATSGLWLAADCRVLRFSNTDFLDDIGIQWQSSPAGEQVVAAKFALLTLEQLSQLRERGKGKVVYMSINDSSAFILKRAGSWAAGSSPWLYLRTGDNNVLDVEITATPVPKASHIDLVVAASEGNPENGRAHRKWVGSARVPVMGRYILVDIPTAREHPAGTLSRVMVLVAPELFVWREGVQVTVLPWGRMRIISIKGRRISTAWMPPKKD